MSTDIHQYLMCRKELQVGRRVQYHEWHNVLSTNTTHIELAKSTGSATCILSSRTSDLAENVQEYTFHCSHVFIAVRKEVPNSSGVEHMFINACTPSPCQLFKAIIYNSYWTEFTV